MPDIAVALSNVNHQLGIIQSSIQRSPSLQGEPLDIRLMVNDTTIFLGQARGQHSSHQPSFSPSTFSSSSSSSPSSSSSSSLSSPFLQPSASSNSLSSDETGSKRQRTIELKTSLNTKRPTELLSRALELDEFPRPLDANIRVFISRKKKILQFISSISIAKTISLEESATLLERALFRHGMSLSTLAKTKELNMSILDE